jgi:hypothetical protein
MPGPGGIYDGEVRSRNSRPSGGLETVEWSKCRRDAVAKPGAQFPKLDCQRLIFSLEFVAQMAIADYRRDSS